MTDAPAQQGAMEIPTQHAALVADLTYGGVHRQYVACLGCYEEAVAHAQSLQATLAARDARIAFMRTTIECGAAIIGDVQERRNSPDKPTKRWLDERLQDALHTLAAGQPEEEK